MAEGQAPAGPAGQLLNLVGEAQAVMDMPNLLLAKATLDLLQFLPKMPAARLFGDLVFQFGHSHPHPPTFGVPIPSVGPILAAGAVNVLINGLPAARNGDLGLAAWCGGYFPIFEVMFGSSHVFIGGSRAARMLMDPTLHCLPDMFSKGKGMSGMTKAIAKQAAKQAAKAAAKQLVQSVVMTGAMKMLQAAAAAEQAQVSESEGEAEGQAAADAEIAAAEAAAAGVEAAMTALQMAADAAAAAMSALLGKDPGAGFPLGFIMMGSPNVLIGGFPMPGWSTILKGLGKLLKPLLRKIQMMLPPGRLRNAMCPATGHPVEVVTGRMFTSQTDFEIDGRIPISFDRLYDTSSIDYESTLGWGWTHPYDQHLWESKRYNCLILRNEENRQVRFDKLKIGERSFQPLERLWLERKGETEYEIFDCKDGQFYRFSRVVEGDFDSEDAALRLTEIADRSGNRLQLKHDGKLLSEINGGAGDFVTFHYHDSFGRTRLFEIRHHLKNGQNISLMKFGYNEDSELISAVNRTYVPYTYLYENHLMTRETNRNKLSFYFEYDGAGQNARCLHTWGDEGIYERRITYVPKSNLTKVKDSLGGETIYHYNGLGLVTKIFNPEGGVYQFEYGDSGELLKEIDELGRIIKYQYDEQLNPVREVGADGATFQIEYDEFCQPLAVTDEADSRWLHEYDAQGNMTATVNQLNARREYEYNDFGDVTILRDALGNETSFEWNNSGQVTLVRSPLGDKTRYSYNERGFLSEVTEDFTGLKVDYQYDDAGRIKRLAEINSRGETFNVQRFEYDDQDNLTLYTDSLGNKTSYRYAGFNKVVKRVDALGFSRQFKYDTEERVREVINERGESYFLEYDLLFRLIEETGFDKAKSLYKYNQAGDLIYQQDALKRETFYQYDAGRRITKVLKSDSSTINYDYDKSGRLVRAENADSAVERTYDALWQVASESQNGQTIRYEYDAEGRRIARILETTEDGLSRVEYDYNADSDLSLIKIGDRVIDYKRDLAGRLTARQMPNGLREQFDYDVNGRLSGQKITVGGGHEIVRRNYGFDALGNVSDVNDSLRGARRYNFDAVERLKKVERIIAGENIRLPETGDVRISNAALPAEKRIWQAGDRGGVDSGQIREIEEFHYDGDGNLLERKSSVRGVRQFAYGAGDRLVEQSKAQYIYDAVGNLIQKRLASGAAVSYEYDVDNQLISVSTETGGKVEFRYDAFGRRTAKITDQGTTGFLWDGNVLLSERKDSQLPVEYIHEEYIPLARIKGSEIEIYHTDYLGTPKEVTDQRGEIVWQGNYDEFGKITAATARTEQNIRFQGQYEDAETGLFYNRFRYYDADGCRYINQDPAGLLGDYNLYDYCQSPTTGVDPLGLTNWGDYLENTLGVPKPKKGTMYRPHAHHIVFKKGKPSQQADLNISKAILKKYGIDYLHGRENLIWAPNKNHSDDAAAKVRRALQRADRTKGTKAQKKAAVKRALRRMGKKFADDTIC